MKDCKNLLISRHTSISEVIKVIDHSTEQIALVIDQENRLLGTITDGDIRRGALRGIGPEGQAFQIMNNDPITFVKGQSPKDIGDIIGRKLIHHVPIIGQDRTVLGIKMIDDIIKAEKPENWVILMAGGQGSRLKPLTDECPKPLLKIGNKPLMEIIIDNFREYGFRKYFIAVNYRANMVEEYFGNGEKWAVDISYLKETKQLGTAGALSMLPSAPQNPIIIMNGDLLTKVNFRQLLKFHKEHGATATMCVREYSFQVPFGVASMDNYKLLDIDEKPVQHLFVNAGIYVLNPEAMGYLNSNEYLDMTNFLKELKTKGRDLAVFPLREYWLDIGRLDDYNRANQDYNKIFNDR